MAENFKESCAIMRKRLKESAASVLELKQHSAFKIDHPVTADRGEMIANVMLAYRHLEDASMRLGKAIQAYEGGVSIYDGAERRPEEGPRG